MFSPGLKLDLPEGIADDWKSAFNIFHDSVDSTVCSRQ